MNAAIKFPFDFSALVSKQLLTGKSCKWILLICVSLLIFITILPDAVYIRQYPQDIFGYLDGIHRTVSGQVAYRDFFAKLGILVYALPALFVRLGADPLLSLAYAQAALLTLNLVLLLHLLNTRISGLPGLLFGLWTTLLLAARMNLGEDPQYVTFSMNFNRYCTVFLSEIFILLFIPSRNTTFINAITDVVLISFLTLILFYSKCTYFVAATGALVLSSLMSRANARQVMAAVLLFLVVALSLEVRYRFHRAYLAEIIMMLQSSGLSRGGDTFINYKGILALILGNLPELVLCAIAPFIVLYRHRTLSRLDALIFLFVAGISVALLSQNAQLQVLALPFSLLLIALDIVDRQTESGTRLIASRSVIWAITIWMWFLYSYPLGVNCALSFAKSIRAGRPIGAEKTIRRFLIAWTDWRSSDPELIPDVIRGEGSRLDLFERARVTGIPGMPLSEAEYAISLEDGFKAARDGCGENARILTADEVNPFPAVLDLPVGGGMVWLEPRTFSLNRHPSADKMFHNITCVMVPNVPICYPCRELLLRIYGEFLKSRFTITAETDYWKLYRVNPDQIPRFSATTSLQ
jgi:hypothetical protein